MNSKIEQLIRKARFQFFTNSLMFFGMMANKFIWNIKPLDEYIEGFVQLDDLGSSKIENGSIYINDFYLIKPNYHYNNLVFIICHELLHILHKHGIRKQNRNHIIWNVACDHVIEVFLKQLKRLITPYDNKYNIIPTLEYNSPKCTAEEAYEWLLNNQHVIKIKQLTDMIIEVSNKNNEYMFTVIIPPEGNNTENIIEQITMEARAIFENLKSKGNLPGQLIGYLDQILKIEIPWEKLIEKSIKINVIMKPDDRTWKCPNKYFIPQNIILPGYSTIDSKEGTGVLIIGIDTSRSISRNDLKKFSSVIEQSLDYFLCVKVIIHDTTIYQKVEFTKDNILTFYNFLTNIGYQGRGGTSHKKLFDEIELLWNENKDELSMVICLTDMDSNIEQIYQKYSWVKNNLPLVFIITQDGKFLNLEKQFGHITQIQMN